jgi:3-hydroxyisobutyrate dehydrogenase
MGLTLPGLNLAKELYDRVAADGGADDGTHALFRFYFEGKQVAD